jgi:hypothetical protein
VSKYVPDARAGDIIRCVNGHELYRLLADIVPGSKIESSNFDPIGDTSKPEYRKTIEPCHICGMPWITTGVGGGYVLCNVKKKL